MNTPTDPVEDYLSKIQEAHRPAMVKLRALITDSLPDGFEECMSYGMIGYVVPKSRYPKGYHVKPELPLPFLSLASQKNNISLYHSGIYSIPELHEWWVSEYAQRVPTKLDMGKSCVRFKNVDKIPYDLLTELCRRVTVDQWIEAYESATSK